MKRGRVMYADRGICYAGKEKEQLFYFVKSHEDVFAVPSSYLTFQLYFNVLFKHILGHALKGREAVDRASHFTGKKRASFRNWFICRAWIFSVPIVQKHLSIYLSWHKHVGKCFAESGWTKSTLLNALLN